MAFHFPFTQPYCVHYRCEKGLESNKHMAIACTAETKKKLVDGVGITVADHLGRTTIESSSKKFNKIQL